MRIQSKGKAEMSTNRVSQFEGLRRGNGRLLERALVVVRCVEWPALVVAGRANVKQPALVVVGRAVVEKRALVVVGRSHHHLPASAAAVALHRNTMGGPPLVWYLVIPKRGYFSATRGSTLAPSVRLSGWRAAGPSVSWQPQSA